MFSGFSASIRFPSNEISPRVGFFDAGNRLKDRALSGPVSAEQADRLAFQDFEIQIVDRLEYTVMDRQTLDTKHRLTSDIGLDNDLVLSDILGVPVGHFLAKVQGDDPVA